MPNLFGIIVIALFGSLGWLLAILVTIQRVRLLTRGIRATGTIVRSKVTTDARPGAQRRATRTPVIQVVDETTGERFEFQSSFGTSATTERIGRKVPVRYLPDDHSAAEIDGFLPMWFFPLGAAVIGTLLLGSLWYLRLRGRA